MLFLTLLGLPAGAAEQSPLSAAVKRMRERLDEIARYKQEQVIGENSAGYLELVKAPDSEKGKKRVAGLIEAENADRRLVYEAIAARTDTPVKQVGRQRAVEIYKKAKPGVMLEVEKGVWRPKKQATE